MRNGDRVPNPFPVQVAAAPAAHCKSTIANRIHSVLSESVCTTLGLRSRMDTHVAISAIPKGNFGAVMTKDGAEGSIPIKQVILSAACLG